MMFCQVRNNGKEQMKTADYVQMDRIISSSDHGMIKYMVKTIQVVKSIVVQNDITHVQDLHWDTEKLMYICGRDLLL